jgi:D-3-phosphoglycerate dehydrogenase / 2-oxoglutarate reductase
MIKILANDGIEPDGKTLLENAGFSVDTNSIPQEELATKLQDYQVITVRSATKVRKELIDLCPNLKIIARGGVGMDNIDVEYARSKGIEVINTPAASSLSVAELAFGHIFSLSRFLQDSNRNMPQGDSDFKKLKSNYSKGIELRGKTIGIIGFGRIGQEVARIGLGLGMKVIASDPFINEVNLDIPIQHIDTKVTVHLKTIAIDEVFKNADFISLHVPSTDKPLVSTSEFAMMKSSAYIINCARGGVIDEAALLIALDNGEIAGAGLDTFDNEPNPNRALLNHPKISVSPHIGASTNEAQLKIGNELAERIIGYFGG